mmetsp:Transcript_29264/g.39545  ORF Transcript_29264/g.39545 Transcript_29264/m.39545 type:complete len:81 (+) Transcript_29264:399-641(+)
MQQPCHPNLHLHQRSRHACLEAMMAKKADVLKKAALQSRVLEEPNTPMMALEVGEIRRCGHHSHVTLGRVCHHRAAVLDP